MPVFDIPLGEWLPDRPDFKNPGCEVADNVIPGPGGYNPLPALNARSAEASGAVYGAQQLFNNTGGSVIVGGTSDSLFTLRGTLTETAGMTAIGAGEAWDFAQFNSFVVATAQNNAPQYLTNINTDDTWSALTGSPPNAKRCAKVNEFLMLGSIAGAPNRIQWSAFNNPAGSWAVDRLTQAGFADLDSSFGEVQRIIGGRYATVFQERGISRLTYVGPPTVWRVDPISVDRGAIAPFAVVSIGYQTYFLAQDGFYITNGSAIEPVGTRRINKWFFDTVQQSQISRVQGAVDWQNKLIVWAFHSLGSGDYDRILCYSWEENRWTSGTVTQQWMVSAKITGKSIDDLDAIYGNLDSIGQSLDSLEFRDGERRLAAFANVAGTSTYHVYDGAPLEAVFETGEFQPSPGRRAFVSEATPIMDAQDWNATFTLKARDGQDVEMIYPAVATAWGGIAPVRGEGKKMAIRMTKPAGGMWADAQFIQIRYEQGGFR